MNPLKTLSLNVKLPLIIVGLGLTVAVSLEVVNIVEVRNMLIEDVKVQFDATVEMEAVGTKNWLLDNQAALLGLAASPSTQTAVMAMAQSWSETPDAGRMLQRAYITDNPNPVGQKSGLQSAVGPETYHKLHATYHPYYVRAVDLQHFYDVFLVDLQGNIVYSYAKETDFATNLVTGPYAASNLAMVAKSAIDGQPGATYFSDFAHYAASAGAPAAFIATQILNQDGKLLGIIAVQLDSARLSALQDVRESDVEIYILGADGLSRTAAKDAGADEILSALPDLPQVRAAVAGQSEFFVDVTLRNGEIGYARTKQIEMGGTIWSLIVERPKSHVWAPLNRMILDVSMVAVLLSILLLGLGYFFARSVTRPIGRMDQVMGEIAGGNLQVSIPDANRLDEIGRMGQSLQTLLDKLSVARLAEEERATMQAELQEVMVTLRGRMNDLAGGDLSHPIDEAFPKEYEGLRSDFNRILSTLSDTINQVVEAAQSIRGRSTEISASSDDLSRRTENQAAALEETAAALDELTVSVKSAADSAREVESIVGQARKGAEESGIVVQGAVAAMAEIEKSSEQISQIIGAIDDIAFQTNLLALNAGVEAARAGDAGKGFAVVASEVRALAHRSSAAAKEIKALISASALHVGRGVDQVGRAGEALHSIVGSVGNIATLVSNIAAGAAEQSAGLGEINFGVTQLDQVTQQNAAMVEGSTAASHKLRQDATGLSDLVARFRLGGAAGARGESGATSTEIALSHFVPASFASSETLAEQAMDEPPATRQRSALGGKAVWQDF